MSQLPCGPAQHAWHAAAQLQHVHRSMCHRSMSTAACATAACPLQHVLPLPSQDLDVPRMLRGQEPPCKLQLTHLADGATILAISTSHALLDGRSFAMLVNALAVHYRALGAGPGPCAGLGAAAGPLQQQAAGAAAGKQLAGVMEPVVDRSLLLPGNVPRSLTATSSAAGTLAASTLAASTISAPSTSGTTGISRASASTASSSTTSSSSHEQLMRQLSLHTQQVEEHPPMARILRNLWRATSGTLSENWRYPNVTFDLTTEVLHLPQRQVAALKDLAARSSSSRGTAHAAGSSKADPGISGVALATLGASDGAAGAAAGDTAGGAAAGGAADFISTNDAVAALFWTTVCQLRSRPLPGTAPQVGANALGLAVDLRHNGLKGHLPANYFGNAVWALYVDSVSGSGSSSNAGGAAASSSTGGAEQAQQEEEEGTYVRVLREAARRVRGSLQRFRSSPDAGNTVVELAYRQHVASTRQSVGDLTACSVPCRASYSSSPGHWVACLLSSWFWPPGGHARPATVPLQASCSAAAGSRAQLQPACPAQLLVHRECCCTQP
jgi:hypothetical protein